MAALANHTGSAHAGFPLKAFVANGDHQFARQECMSSVLDTNAATSLPDVTCAAVRPADVGGSGCGGAQQLHARLRFGCDVDFPANALVFQGFASLWGVGFWGVEASSVTTTTTATLTQRDCHESTCVSLSFEYTVHSANGSEAFTVAHVRTEHFLLLRGQEAHGAGGGAAHGRWNVFDPDPALAGDA